MGGPGADHPGGGGAKKHVRGLDGSVAWSQLSVGVRRQGGAQGDGARTILRSVSGCARRGRMTAILGPTGSGKTTLLNTLAHRLDPTLTYTGQLLYGANRPWSKALKRRIGFVEQDDIVIPSLTVRQTLTYTSRLRLPHPEVSDEQAAARVEGVIASLRLTKAANTAVSAISGGERKRLCIAQELIVEPSCILLDEPTSGLDSTIALEVVRILKDLCAASPNPSAAGDDGTASTATEATIDATRRRAGVAVVMTIHQPSSTIYDLFDDLLLLHDGRVVYQGEAGKAAAYFGALGKPVPPGHSTSDHLMNLVVLRQLDDAGVQAALRRDFGGTQMAGVQAGDGGDEEDGVLEAWERRRYAVPWHVQVWVLVSRTWTAKSGEEFTLQNLLLYIGLSLIAGVLWAGMEWREEDVFQRMSLCFWVVGTWTFFPLFNSLFVFPGDEQVVKKDLSIGAFRLSAYFTARTVVLIPLMFAWPTLYVPIVVGMSGLLKSFWSALLFYMLMLVQILTMQALGLTISAGVKPSNILTCCILLITFLFSWGGLFFPIEDMADWYSWLVYTNLVQYTWQLGMRVCFGTGVDSISLSCGSATTTGYDEYCGHSASSDRTIPGTAVLDEYGVDLPVWLAMLVLLIYMVVFRLLAYGLLRYHWVYKAASVPIIAPTPMDDKGRPAEDPSMVKQ